MAVILGLQLVDHVANIFGNPFNRCNKAAVTKRSKCCHQGEVIGHMGGSDGQARLRVVQILVTQVDAASTNKGKTRCAR